MINPDPASTQYLSHDNSHKYELEILIMLEMSGTLLSMRLLKVKCAANMDFDAEFVMELFLDDSVTTINRLVVAAANVLTENIENIAKINEVFSMEQKHIMLHPISNKNEKSEKIGVLREVTGFYENIVLNYNDSEYIERLNMKKNTVQGLVLFLRDIVNSANSVVPLDKKVHVFLWLLTSDASFNEVGALFGLNKSSVSYIFHEIALLLSQQRHDFITWPSLEEQHVTRVKVNSLHKFPNCVGFIDACRLKVGSKHKRAPPDTILLQAVCDESYMFIDIHVGNIGLTRKSKVFKESNLSQELKNFVDFDNHIIGDSEYKLKKNLITPFTSEELLTSEEMKFNEIHWKTRAYIGHAFEMLKDRFKRLNHLDISKPKAVNSVICAACVLHNFVLLHEGCTMVKEEAITCDDSITLDSNLVKTAVEKRQFLCNYINYIHSI